MVSAHLGEIPVRHQTELGRERLEQHRDEIRGETTNLREEIRNESATNRRQTDALMIQIRALQLGGAIAAFAIAAIVFLTRLIK